MTIFSCSNCCTPPCQIDDDRFERADLSAWTVVSGTWTLVNTEFAQPFGYGQIVRCQDAGAILINNKISPTIHYGVLVSCSVPVNTAGGQRPRLICLLTGTDTYYAIEYKMTTFGDNTNVLSIIKVEAGVETVVSHVNGSANFTGIGGSAPMSAYIGDGQIVAGGGGRLLCGSQIDVDPAGLQWGIGIAPTSAAGAIDFEEVFVSKLDPPYCNFYISNCQPCTTVATDEVSIEIGGLTGPYAGYNNTYVISSASTGIETSECFYLFTIPATQFYLSLTISLTTGPIVELRVPHETIGTLGFFFSAPWTTVISTDCGHWDAQQAVFAGLAYQSTTYDQSGGYALLTAIPD